nr:unnamed protein product [Callosobruchus analis]
MIEQQSHLFVLECQNFSADLLTPGHECVRECKDGEPPKFCYYKFTLELYETLGAACDVCQPNDMFAPRCSCILADGFERTLLTINKMLPAPSIQVCAGDRIIVDVMNAMDGYEATIHWHGLQQENTQYYDGVPMITQCPINAGQIFRYQMISNKGTYFYHAHTGLQKFDGLSGSRIVGQDPESLLINGKGRWTDRKTGETTSTPIEVFNVKKGFRYRFRMINSMTSSCTMAMRVLDHKLTVIATDGEACYIINYIIGPYHLACLVTKRESIKKLNLTTFTGERYDFVINATQEEKQYWMQSLNDPALNCAQITPSGMCMCSLKSGYPIEDEDLLKEEPDLKLYVNFTFTSFEPEELFKPDTHRKYAVLGGQAYSQAFVNGYSFKMPPSPLLSQYQDAKSTICPPNGRNPEGCNGNCSCTNVINVPLNAVVEIVLIDGVTFNDVHSFHLHGYSFKVVGMGTPDDLNITAANTTIIKQLDEQGQLTRNLINPPVRTQ